MPVLLFLGNSQIARITAAGGGGGERGAGAHDPSRQRLGRGQCQGVFYLLEMEFRGKGEKFSTYFSAQGQTLVFCKEAQKREPPDASQEG